MTLTSAFNSALSGLTATRFASALVSDNIANALTPGYSRRSLAVSNSGDTTPGVRIGGVVRHTDPALIASRRQADAAHGFVMAEHGFFADAAALIGTPGEAGSLTDHLSRFQASLTQAASRPDSDQRLSAVAFSAKDLVAAISRAADGVTALSRQADQSISGQVDHLNQSLERVQDLNTRIVANRAGGHETAGLRDQRRVLIDEINQIVPVRIIERQTGQVTLYSEGGTILLDGTAATVSFAETPNLMPHMTLENGLLSGLSVNGLAMRTGDSGGLRGGTLAAQFEIRDSHAVAAQADLDSLARDLVDRFQDSNVDPTLGPGDAGLFTDGGSAFAVADEVGLAGRLELNALVSPEGINDVWRLRDGLQAATAGDVGNATRLQAYSDALEGKRAVASGTLATGQVSFAGLASSLASRMAGLDANSDRALSFAASGLAELTRQELADGVDTDAELQTLMLMERAYEANARVLQTIDDLMETLLRL
jgi:flagellar hook-associated protein 1